MVTDHASFSFKSNSWLTSLRIDKFFHLIMTSCSPPFWWCHVLRHFDDDVMFSAIVIMTSRSQPFWWWRHALDHFDDDVMFSPILMMRSWSPPFCLWRHTPRHFDYDVMLSAILMLTPTRSPPPVVFAVSNEHFAFFLWHNCFSPNHTS